MQMRRSFSEGGSGKKITSSTPAIHTKPTTEQQPKKNVPDIQPSKTHKAEDQGGETKKQIKGTKIVVNSVIEQNVMNPSDNAAPKLTKNQVRIKWHATGYHYFLAIKMSLRQYLYQFFSYLKVNFFMNVLKPLISKKNSFGI